MQPVFDCGLHAKRRKRTQNKNRYKASPGEIRSAVVNEFHRVKVVGSDVAPQLNTLKGPGSTGQGGLWHDYKERYPDRAIGGKVAEDLFKRGLCLLPGRR